MKPVKITLVMFFFVTWMGYWIYISGTIENFSHTFEVIFEEESKIVSPAVTLGLTGWAYQLEKIEGYLFTSFYIIAALYWCNKKESNLYRLSLLFGGASLIIIITAVATSGFSQAIILKRWQIFMYILISVSSAMGILFISNYPRHKTNKIFVFLCIMLIFTSFSITAHNAARTDSPVYLCKERPIRYNFGLMQSELCAANRLMEIYAGALVSDGYYNIYFNRYLEKTIEDLIIFAESKEYTNLRKRIEITYQFDLGRHKIKETNKKMILIREYIMRDYEYNKQDPANELETLPYSRIYDSKKVIAYLCL